MPGKVKESSNPVSFFLNFDFLDSLILGFHSCLSQQYSYEIDGTNLNDLWTVANINIFRFLSFHHETDCSFSFSVITFQRHFLT